MKIVGLLFVVVLSTTLQADHLIKKHKGSVGIGVGLIHEHFSDLRKGDYRYTFNLKGTKIPKIRLRIQIKSKGGNFKQLIEEKSLQQGEHEGKFTLAKMSKVKFIISNKGAHGSKKKLDYILRIWRLSNKHNTTVTNHSNTQESHIIKNNQDFTNAKKINSNINFQEKSKIKLEKSHEQYPGVEWTPKN